MAKRMKSKIQPAVMKMHFAFTAGTANQVQHIDISQCASLLNRRFYRQGLNWAVAGFKLTTTGTTGLISIHKLPNTWVMSNAWEKGFRLWQKMNKAALAETQSVAPKFMDFKIYANKDHHSAGSRVNLLPSSAGTLANSLPQRATAGEWEYSKYVIPDTTDGAVGGIENREIIAVGANYPPGGAALGAVSLIEGYAASRGLPNIEDPNTPNDFMDVSGSSPENWMVALFNDGVQQDAQVLSDMIENNIAPYPFENADPSITDTMYPGGANQLSSLEIHDQEYVTGTTVGGTTRLQGGNFPCGLIEIATSNFPVDGQGNPSQLLLEVTLVPGSHRGYLAESMTEM